MNIKEAKQEIKRTVAIYQKKDADGTYQIPKIRQRPILLMGPPGIGKTQIMEQVAKECEIGLVSYTITHHTRQSAVGLPFIRQEEFEGRKVSVTEYTMSEILASVYRKMRETGKKEGILFIDEINCVSETLAPTMLQFLQCKTFGNQEVPDGWIIVAAGNPPEYNKSVREFDVVTLDRVRQMDIQADYEVWREYAADAGVHRAILGYLDLHPDHFYRIEKDVDGMHFVTARGWEDFSCLLYHYRQEKFEITTEVILEYLPHLDVAEELSAYLELYGKYEEEYPVSDILQGQVKSVVYERLSRAAFDERVVVVELVLTALLGRLHSYWEGKEESQRNRSGVKEALENAFTFMEDAFAGGEEMVLFVTELTLSADSVRFMAEEPVEKYLEYSEELLIGTRRQKLLTEIKTLGAKNIY